MLRARRERFATKQVPATWETPAAAVLAVVVVAVAMPVVVQGLLGWFTSGEFVWPSGRLLYAYGSLIHGRFGVGLQRGVAAGLPSDWLMWWFTAVGEVVVLGAVVAVGLRLRRMQGAGSRHGLATPAQASRALGAPRLRVNAAVIRPDLYAPARRLHRRRASIQLGSTAEWTLGSRERETR